MKFPRIILIIILCSCGIASLAQKRISGNITGASPHDLLIATIRLISAQDSTVFKATSTDASGHFIIDYTDPNKSLLLEASAMGYNTIFQTLPSPLRDTFVLNIALKPLGQ